MEKKQEVILSSLPTQLTNSLMEFQKEGVLYAINKDGRCLIADEMGLGKTLQAIAVALYYRKEWPVLIIVPSSLKFVWVEELEKWIVDILPEDINLVSSGSDVRNIENASITIATYGLLCKASSSLLVEALTAKRFRVVIADESHYLRNFRTKKCRAIVPLIQSANRRILLSGTPALSRPVELYTQLNAILPGHFGTFWKFTEYFCDAKYEFVGKMHKRNVRGSSNLQELQSLLMSSVMIRREKQEVLTQLPPKQRQKILFNLKQSQQKTDIGNLFKEIRPCMKQECSFNDNNFSVISKIQRLYQLSAEAKIGPVCEYVKYLCEESRSKFIIFAHHHNMMDAIQCTVQAAKVKFIRIDGSVGMTDRTFYVKRYQSDPECRVAILSILAAGVGLTFTAATLVVFAEMHWTPGVMIQCEDRTHRIGQKNSVSIHYLVAKDTLDEWVWSSIGKKTAVVTVTLNGKCQKLDATDGSQELVNTLSRQNITPTKFLLDNVKDSSTTDLATLFLSQQTTQKTIQEFVRESEKKRKLKNINTIENDSEKSHKEKSTQIIIVSDDEDRDDVKKQRKKPKRSPKKSQVSKISIESPRLEIETEDKVIEQWVLSPNSHKNTLSPDCDDSNCDWSCDRCTFINKSYAFSCDICKTPRKNIIETRRNNNKAQNEKFHKSSRDKQKKPKRRLQLLSSNKCPASVRDKLNNERNESSDISHDLHVGCVPDTIIGNESPNISNGVCVGSITDTLTVNDSTDTVTGNKSFDISHSVCVGSIPDMIAENESTNIITGNESSDISHNVCGGSISDTTTGNESTNIITGNGSLDTSHGIDVGSIQNTKAGNDSPDAHIDVCDKSSQNAITGTESGSISDSVPNKDITFNNACTCFESNLSDSHSKNCNDGSTVDKSDQPNTCDHSVNNKQISVYKNQHDGTCDSGLSNDNILGSTQISNHIDNGKFQDIDFNDMFFAPSLVESWTCPKCEIVNKYQDCESCLEPCPKTDLRTEDSHIDADTRSFVKERFVNLDRIPVYNILLFDVSKYTGRIYLYHEDGTSIGAQFLPLDIDTENYEALPDILLRPENMTLAKNFVAEWNMLTETKKRYVTKHCHRFVSPIDEYEKLKSQQKPSNERCLLQTVVMKDNEASYTRIIRKAKKTAEVVSDEKPNEILPGPKKFDGSGIIQAVGSDGIPLCLNCKKLFQCNLVSKETISSENNAWLTRLCSANCMDAYWMKSQPSYCRDKLYELERGVCQICGVNGHEIYTQIRSVKDCKERAKIIKNSQFKSLTVAQKVAITRHPVEGQFWHADHIKPVWQGGGLCDIDNLRTLCTMCHKKVTAEQSRQRAQLRKLQTSVKSHDIKQFYPVL